MLGGQQQQTTFYGWGLVPWHESQQFKYIVFGRLTMIEHTPGMMVVEMLQSKRISKGICWCMFWDDRPNITWNICNLLTYVWQFQLRYELESCADMSEHCCLNWCQGWCRSSFKCQDSSSRCCRKWRCRAFSNMCSDHPEGICFYLRISWCCLLRALWATLGMLVILPFSKLQVKKKLTKRWNAAAAATEKLKAKGKPWRCRQSPGGTWPCQVSNALMRAKTHKSDAWPNKDWKRHWKTYSFRMFFSHGLKCPLLLNFGFVLVILASSLIIFRLCHGRSISLLHMDSFDSPVTQADGIVTLHTFSGLAVWSWEALGDMWWRRRQHSYTLGKLWIQKIHEDET